MPAEEAAWVREHAWLPPMRRDYAQWPHLYDRCPCHRFLAGSGACGACQAGDHDDCARRMERWPANAPLFWVTDRLGRVPIQGDPRCTCYRAAHADAAPVPEQGDLRSLLAA